MPFAPICRAENASKLFKNINLTKHAAEFMTVTVNCTKKMRRLCPAVVHIDGTARPQLLTETTNPLIYEVLSIYERISGKPALVNTSFNIHEEPIVCSPEDALRGFFEAGLDVLYLEGNIILLDENRQVEAYYLRENLARLKTLQKKSAFQTNHMPKKEFELQFLTQGRQATPQQVLQPIKNSIAEQGLRIQGQLNQK